MVKRDFTGLLLAGILFLTGCGSQSLTYNANLGYDFSKMEYSELVFKVYHSNTENHRWEKIAEMPCTPPESHSADIRVEGAQDRVTVILEDNFCEKDEYSASYFTNDEMTYEFAVEGFEGNLSSYQIFEINDSNEEQFYRLYPIANGDGTIFTALNLNEPYDVDHANLDNLLVTLTIVK